MATKTAPKFALPHTTTYTLVDSYYAGSLIDGGGTSCQNCGKLITQVGIVEDAQGTRFNVGMDCAATLSGLQPFALDHHQHRFQQVKSLVAKIRKARKEFADALTVTATYSYDGVSVYVEGMVAPPARGSGRRFSDHFDKELFERIIQPAGQGLVPAAVEPVKDWFGTEPSPYRRGEKVTVLVKGERKEAAVLGISPNRYFEDSQYSETLFLAGVTGRFDPSHVLTA